jgi:hypothetical protein
LVGILISLKAEHKEEKTRKIKLKSPYAKKGIIFDQIIFERSWQKLGKYVRKFL